MYFDMTYVLVLLLVLDQQSLVLSYAESETICQTGRAQSPIAVDLSQTSYTSYPTFSFSKSYDQSMKFRVLKQAGQTISITPILAESQVLTVSGGCLSGVFTFQSVHLHWPRSEHTFLKHDYIAEAHFIHQKVGTDEIAVFAFFFTSTKAPSEEEQDTISSWDRVFESGNNTSVTIVGGLASMMAGNKNRFIHYAGSLTTPPCTEGVLWILVASSIKMGDTALSRMQSEIISSNYRATQPLYGRSVKRSFPSPSWDI